MALAFSPHLALSAQVRQARAALWAVVGVCFVIQPALTLILALLLAWSHQKDPRALPSVLVLSALYLALVNVTKLPESDLATYLEAFEDARHLYLTTFLTINVREPLYYVLLYGLANLLGVDGRVYVFLSTLIPYLVFGTAVLRLCTALRLERRAELSLLVFLLFFPQLFSLSAHLFRQMLAASLVMLFLTDQAVTGRRRWGIGLLGMLVHYSSMPFLLLSLFQPLKRYSRVLSVLFHALTLVLVYALAVQVAPLFLDVPVLGMVFQRLVNGEGAQLDPLTLPVLGSAVLYLAVALFSLARMSGPNLGTQDWTVMLCTVTVCVVVLMTSVEPTLSEIALRYYFYLYFLIGLVLPFLMVRLPLSRWAVHGLALLFEPAWMLWGHLASSMT